MDLFQWFLVVFVVLAIGCAIAHYFSRDAASQASAAAVPASFPAFQRSYLLVYFIVMASDWLQGPYVYALYTEYGFGKAEIGQLFVAGFTSSMIFGTFIGGVADKWGRKTMALSFAVFYGVGCITKLSSSYSVLMVGRVLSGVATSLLFSVFEAWMVSEHKTQQYPEELLAQTFSLATFGNGLTAIGAGVVASFAARSFGYVSPFMLALLVLIVAFVVISYSWTENYGDSTLNIGAGFRDAVQAIAGDLKISLLGAVSSLFEASMYSFVFMWSPVLISAAKPYDLGELPFGMIFACFMICIMIGSSLFSIGMQRGISCHNMLRIALVIGAVSLSVPLWSEDFQVLIAAFFVFEIACGIYFPSAGTLRGRVIPEKQRAAVMNVFRVPLNLLVTLILLNVDQMSTYTVFFLITAWMAIAYVLHHTLIYITWHEEQGGAKETEKNEASITSSGH